MKEHKGSTMGQKGLYEAITWLNYFITYFENDYNLWLEESKDIPLTEENKLIIDEQKAFMQKMFH